MSATTNPLKILTDSNELQFQASLDFGELLAWDKNTNQFVFCTKSKFSHWMDSILPTAQNTSISTITQKFDEFCHSQHGSLVLSQLSQTQIDNLNRNMTDLALKISGQKRDIQRKELAIEKNGTQFLIISKRKIVEDSDHFKIRQIENARQALANRWKQLQDLAVSRSKTQWLHTFIETPLKASFVPFKHPS